MVRRTYKRILGRVCSILLIGILCFSLFPFSSLAETDIFGLNGPFDGDGWSLTAEKTLTLESNQGWWNAMKHGFSAHVEKLIIGKELTDFRLYFLPYELPSPDFFYDVEAAGYHKDGEPYYDYFGTAEIYPQVIEVEVGNPVFYVTGGLLINKATSELVLSEMGVADVVIPEGVKTITREAFSQREVQSVQFPSSLETVGESAFSDCVNLGEIVLPDSLMELQSGAFSGCKSLQDVSLPSGLQVLDVYAFSGSAIQYIKIPESLEEIEAYVFSDCDQLQEVLLPSKLKKIKHGAFYGCDQLNMINVPNGIEFIGEYAFSNCYNLKRVILPDSLQQIGDRVFWCCDLSVLQIPSKLAFPVFSEKKGAYILNAHAKRNKSFNLSSVDTVILAGSDYDFGYPAISNAKNVYFLGKPPEDVGQILDRETVENIYCSDEFEFQWTRSTVASWVRQRLQILPAAKLNEQVESIVNATPEPTVTPRPTASPKPTRTPAKTRKPKTTPTQEPSIETKQDTDPILFVFAGVLALVTAGIVVVAVKGKSAKRPNNRKRTKP